MQRVALSTQSASTRRPPAGTRRHKQEPDDDALETSDAFELYSGNPDAQEAEVTTLGLTPLDRQQEQGLRSRQCPPAEFDGHTIGRAGHPSENCFLDDSAACPVTTMAAIDERIDRELARLKGRTPEVTPIPRRGPGVLRLLTQTSRSEQELNETTKAMMGFQHLTDVRQFIAARRMM